MSPTSSSHRAVSSVVAVVVLVAMTVLLVAVVAGFLVTANDAIEEDVQAGVSIQAEPANQLLEIQVITLGNADHVDIAGDPVDHFDPDERTEADFQELEVGDTLEIEHSDLESAGQDGEVSAIAVADDREAVVATETYDIS